ISADCATLYAAAMVDWQPHAAVFSYAHVTMQAVAVGKTVARVRHHTGTVTISERIVISSAIGWRETAFHPQVTITVAVGVNRVRAGGGIRNQRAASPLISPK